MTRPLLPLLQNSLLIALLVMLNITLSYAANQKDLELLAKINNTKTNSLDLSKADLKNYQFVSGKVDLKNANLSGADLSNANLENMDLTNADLSNAILTNTKLKGAILSHANLRYAKLTGALLEQATLTKADLTCANLNDANLTKANFSETIVSGASFINADTTSVINQDSVINNQVTCK